MVTTAALIVAAGRGHRVGRPLPKQYRRLAGPRGAGPQRATLRRRIPRIDRVRVVIEPGRPVALRRRRAGERRAAKPASCWTPVAGGASRQDSVRLGLESLAETPPDLVFIHDGARPLVSEPP